MVWVVLSNRNQKCKINGHLSQAKQLTCGVPEGFIFTLANSELNIIEKEMNHRWIRKLKRLALSERGKSDNTRERNFQKDIPCNKCSKKT